MTVEPTPNTGPAPGKTPPDGVRRNARQLFKAFDGPVDEHFKQSLARLTSRLGERAARQSTNDPQAAAEARRAALEAYDQARAQRFKTALGTAGAAVAAAGIACLIVVIAVTPEPPSPRATATASTEPAPRIEVAAVPLAPTPAPSPPAASIPSPPAVVAASAQVVPAAVSEKAPVELEPVAPVPEPAPAALRRDEIGEVQMRLHSFGFNPGPLDGAPGPMTRAAVLRYQQDRALAQTGLIDRELLAQLRQDPAPQVVTPQVVAPQVAQRAARPAPAARRSDPFEPLRVAAQDFERWLQSLGR